MSPCLFICICVHFRVSEHVSMSPCLFVCTCVHVCMSICLYCGLRWFCKNNSTRLPKPQNMNIITTKTERLNCAIVNIIHCLWFVERGTRICKPNAIHSMSVHVCLYVRICVCVRTYVCVSVSVCLFVCMSVSAMAIFTAPWAADCSNCLQSISCMWQ